MARKKILIDTNIFLEFLLQQDRRNESIKLMQEIEQGAMDAYVTSFSLHSIEVLLDRHQRTKTLQQFLKRVVQAQGLTVYQTSPAEEQRIAGLTKKINLDFDDALQYYVARTLGGALVSFDKDFDETDINRIEPSGMMPR